MRTDNNVRVAVCGFSLVLIQTILAGCSTERSRTDFQSVAEPPRLRPDYAGVTIPPNSAPLNFVVQESGQDYFVQIRSGRGEPIQIESRSGQIRIPAEPWKRLLAQNRGEPLTMDVRVKKSGAPWIRFGPVTNRIAPENIDGYVAYRRFGPLFNEWGKMGIFQRSLESFDEKPVLLNRLTLYNCMNCHNFWRNGTDRWLLHLRNAPGTSMLLTMNGKTRKIDTRTQFNKSPGGYPAWHPSGKLLAFSVGRPLQFFHTVGETRDELDRFLDIIVYDVQTNTVTTTPELSSPDRIEVWPTWSPDGGFLYFCSAPKLDSFLVPSTTGEDSLAYDRIKFDLMRIAYDPARRNWGKLETVVSSADIELSISQPRISPNGRLLVFTGSKYGSFPIFHFDADLYLLDLTRGSIKRLELNSDRAEGFHSWSSNSRWLVFSSKRQDTQFTRLYLAYIDSLGNASKAFVLPQENPRFYDTCLELYNVPEFVKDPIRVRPQALAKAAFSQKDVLAAKLDPAVASSRLSGQTKSAVPTKPPQKERKW